MYSTFGLLGSRARATPKFALFPLGGIPYSRLPEWPDALVRVLAAPAIGAEFVEYMIDLEPGQSGAHPADGAIEHFLYVLSGAADLTLDAGAPHPLTDGSYALLPPDCSYRLTARAKTTLLLLRKRYEPLPQIPGFQPLIGNEAMVKGEIYMGDPGARLQTLIPDTFAHDMAMNIFTFEVGHSLPYTETHVMEHGLYFLSGKGLYYLEDHWMEVEQTDFIWMGPYCPQCYYATGTQPSRYIYYKNVNRDFPL